MPIAIIVACTGEDPDGTAGNVDAGRGETGDAAVDGDTRPLGPVVNDRYQAGQRLRPNFLEVSGESQFLDWYDAEREVHCTFRLATDNQLRCLPDVPVTVAPGDFADAACSVRVAREPAGCAGTPRFVGVAQGCTTRIFATKGPATTSYQRVQGGGCERQPTAGGSQLGDETDPAIWVRGVVEESAEDTGPVRAEILRGDDGSSGFRRWKPRTLATECTWQAGLNSALHCIPRKLVTAAGFTDAACSTALFATVVDACDPPIVGERRTFVTERCVSRLTATEYRELDGAYAGSSYFLEDGTCRPQGNVTGTKAGTALDVEATFGSAELLRVPTSGRLAGLFARFPGGARARIGWYDTLLDAPCEVGPAMDGSLRCLPMAPTAATMTFTDRACTAPTTAAYVAPKAVIDCQLPGRTCPTDCALPEKPRFVSAPLAGGCRQQRRRIYALGSVAQGPIFIKPELAAAVCREANRGDEAVYSVTEQSATDLVAATPTIP